MTDRPAFGDLQAFLAIVAHRSFRRAADELGLSPSSLSHMMRVLETRMGVRLLNRTTRSVAPTEAGARLAEALRPALAGIDTALEAVDTYRGGPSGTLRINTGPQAARLLLTTVVPAFLQKNPGVALDLVNEGRLVDIVADGFDAGIRLREAVPQDMAIVPFGGSSRFIAVASPAYVAAHGMPATPHDLAAHDCIRLRLPSGKLYRWEFERRGEELAIEVAGALTLDDTALMAEAAAAGLGIAYVPELEARTRIRSGALVEVLPDWCPDIDGLCLYYPGHRHVPAALRAFIAVLREELGGG